MIPFFLLLYWGILFLSLMKNESLYKTGVNSSRSEYLVSLKIEKLDEGFYLATSDTLQGSVA